MFRRFYKVQCSSCHGWLGWYFLGGRNVPGNHWTVHFPEWDMKEYEVGQTFTRLRHAKASALEAGWKDGICDECLL